MESFVLLDDSVAVGVAAKEGALVIVRLFAIPVLILKFVVAYVSIISRDAVAVKVKSQVSGSRPRIVPNSRRSLT